MTVESSRVHEACSRLRFAEGLRRRWEEARAEAAVQEAAHISFLEGGRVPAEEIRALATQPVDDMDPAEAYTLGIWRAAWRVQQSLPALNRRVGGAPKAPLGPAAVLGTIHKDVCSYLVAAGHMGSASVAIPDDPGAVAAVIGAYRDSSVPALDRCSLMWQTMVSRRVFHVGATPTAILFVKWFLATSGVEPTAVSVLSGWAAINRNRYVNAVKGEAGTAQEAQLGELWREITAESLIEGCSLGEGIARAVQAGSYPPSTP